MMVLQIGPAPETAVDHMREALPVGHLIREERYNIFKITITVLCAQCIMCKCVHRVMRSNFQLLKTNSQFVHTNSHN